MVLESWSPKRTPKTPLSKDAAQPALTRQLLAHAITNHFVGGKRAFLEFVLSHYVSAGVDELVREKLTPLLKQGDFTCALVSVVKTLSLRLSLEIGVRR